jgi:hypothetical protein
MPKCGSSTLEELISTLSISNNFTAMRTPPDLWKNLDANTTARNEFIEMVNNHIQQRKQHIVVDGHFEQIIFPPNSFLDIHGREHEVSNQKNPTHKQRQRVESIQLIRDCGSRSTSLFFYELFDSMAAIQAKATGNLKGHILDAMHVHSNSIAGKEFRFEECLESYACVKGYPFEAYERNGLQYLCGDECIKQVINSAFTNKQTARAFSSRRNPTQSIQVKGAMFHAIQPQYFTVIGALEQMDEFFEMLECAYPTIFHNLLNLYRSKPVHVKSGVASTHYEHSEALMKVVQEACDPETSDAGFVYKKLLPFFRSRYQFMKQNRKRCCRKVK